MGVVVPDHPAPWSQEILGQLRTLLAMVPPGRTFVDPFCGTGLPQLRLLRPDLHWIGVELEEEWAAHDPDCIHGDATKTTFARGSVQGLVTSPAYANRMADQYDGRDGFTSRPSRRRTYAIALGRRLTPGSGAGYQWGALYRDLHKRAWIEAYRYLADGAPALINVKDHDRGGRRRGVVDWHAETLEAVGFHVVEQVPVKTRGFRDGANHRARAETEMILVCRR